MDQEIKMMEYYQELFNHMCESHGLILLQTEMDDIITLIKKHYVESQKCKCEKPIIQKQTRQCGKCKLYIDRVPHILLTIN